MKIRLTIGIPNWLDSILALPVLAYRKYKFGEPYRKIRLIGSSPVAQATCPPKSPQGEGRKGEGKYTIVDQVDFYWLNKYEWFAEFRHNLVYAVRLKMTPSGESRLINMHREIMNPPKGMLVDHRNNYGLDNRRANLRLATLSQNMQNRRKLKKCSSKYYGVSFDKFSGQWRARVKNNGKVLHLGRFDNEIAAARAYDDAVIKNRIEFAKLNFK